MPKLTATPRSVKEKYSKNKRGEPIGILGVVAEKLLEKEEPIGFDEALELTEIPKRDLPALVSLAGKVTTKYNGEGVFLCSIISAQTGNCPEDCSFCSQSSRYSTGVKPQSFLVSQKILEAARRAERLGAGEFCIVISAGGPSKRVFSRVLEAVDMLKEETGLKIGCSLGKLTEEQAHALKQHGVWRYNHNMETARSYFPNVCTTHTYDDRLRTALLVKEAGMELCSGGIIGMGESVRQRVEFAFELRDLDPNFVPINFLNPRPGTPFSDISIVAPLEAVRTIAIFRLILPGKRIVAAGGREEVLRDLQAMGLMAGANAMILGDYLTTPGRSPGEDLRMLDDLEMPVIKDV
ncbi:MAG: biotin synthase BioB [Thermodesulfobacteriota bacterium]